MDTIKTLLLDGDELVSISPSTQPPRRWTPGEWVEATDPLKPYTNGLHAGSGRSAAEAFRAACLDTYPQTAWRVEVDGDVVQDRDTICARRMRIVERLNRHRAFREAFPKSEPAWLDAIDATIMAMHDITRTVRPKITPRDVVLAFAPWKRTDADLAEIAPLYANSEVSAIIDSYIAVDAVAAAFTALIPYTIDAAIIAAGVAADGVHADVAVTACRCARYYFARAIVPSDPHLHYINPFGVLLDYYVGGGSWQEVEKIWSC